MYMVIIKVDTYDHTVGTAEQRAAGEPQQSSNCRHVSTELPFTHTHTHTLNTSLIKLTAIPHILL